ncbi:MAG: hypothetical protein V4611_04040 [Patescibacteria group bacterium]
MSKSTPSIRISNGYEYGLFQYKGSRPFIGTSSKAFKDLQALIDLLHVVEGVVPGSVVLTDRRTVELQIALSFAAHDAHDLVVAILIGYLEAEPKEVKIQFIDWPAMPYGEFVAGLEAYSLDEEDRRPKLEAWDDGVWLKIGSDSDIDLLDKARIKLTYVDGSQKVVHVDSVDVTISLDIIEVSESSEQG